MEPRGEEIRDAGPRAKLVSSGRPPQREGPSSRVRACSRKRRWDVLGQVMGRCGGPERRALIGIVDSRRSASPPRRCPQKLQRPAEAGRSASYRRPGARGPDGRARSDPVAASTVSGQRVFSHTHMERPPTAPRWRAAGWKDNPVAAINPKRRLGGPASWISHARDSTTVGAPRARTSRGIGQRRSETARAPPEGEGSGLPTAPRRPALPAAVHHSPV